MRKWTEVRDEVTEQARKAKTEMLREATLEPGWERPIKIIILINIINNLFLFINNINIPAFGPVTPQTTLTQQWHFHTPHTVTCPCRA